MNILVEYGIYVTLKKKKYVNRKIDIYSSYKNHSVHVSFYVYVTHFLQSLVGVEYTIDAEKNLYCLQDYYQGDILFVL